MKLIRNDKLIKRNKKLGNILFIAGIAVLGGGLVLSFNPTMTKTLLSFAALIVGFVISQISTHIVNRFGRSPRNDELISDNLTKFNNDYSLYIYKAPVPILLVSPVGLWIPVPINATGEIYFDKKWKQRGGAALMKFFGQENIGKPELDVASNEEEITKFLVKFLSEDEMPPINSILVSMNPKAEIGDVSDAPTPIVPLDALRRKIRKFERDSELTIPQDILTKIYNALDN
ncbi:MAG TPA: hypothetical protein DF984_04335 [Anaerolineaceae bacterium]|jgi:hypothetical protein|nr:hypothetical protein [Anaerolineaceae bacterium]